jgi:hypothetical protein
MARNDREDSPNGGKPWEGRTVDGQPVDENGLLPNGMPADWCSDEAIAALNMERDMHPDETEEELTKRIFRENAAAAASRIVKVALTSPSERSALEASKYIVERTLGPVGQAGDAVDPLKAFLNKVEQAANAGSGN